LAGGRRKKKIRKGGGVNTKGGLILSQTPSRGGYKGAKKSVRRARGTSMWGNVSFVISLIDLKKKLNHLVFGGKGLESKNIRVDPIKDKKNESRHKFSSRQGRGSLPMKQGPYRRKMEREKWTEAAQNMQRKTVEYVP